MTINRIVLINYLPKNIDQCIIEIKLASPSLCENDLENWKKSILEFLGEDKVIVESVHKSYLENFNLVRGLDYYTHTAFEITSGALGSQATVCGGGRYDDLIKQMGGPNTPAIGFAIGLERLILLAGKELEVPRNTDIYIINQGLIAESLAMDLSRKLRNYDLLVELDLSGASFSKQFKKANKLKSKSIIVIGDDEATKREYIIRLFDQSANGNKEEVISFENDIVLEKWINNNLLAK